MNRRDTAIKVASALSSIFGASVISFVFLRLAPTNPARLVLGRFATRDAIDKFVATTGLDRPVWEQYLRYIGSFVRGDWGFSYSAGLPVKTLILGRLPASLELGITAFVITIVSAVTLAILVTYRRRPILDGSVQSFTLIGIGVPEFWLGIVLLLVFSEYLGLFPLPEGRLSPGMLVPPSVTGLYLVDSALHLDLGALLDAAWHLFLPAVTLSLFSFCYLTRLLRANLIELSSQPFIVVAQGFGESRWQAFWRHALPNALGPTLTASGMVLGQMIAGAVIVESVFQWPGIGQLVTKGIQDQDYSVVQGFILLTACLYVGINLIVDMIVLRLDPRSLRWQAGGAGG